MAEKQTLLELPVLGFPFPLGPLYNANRNQIVPAISLWKDAHGNVLERRNITHNTDVITSDSLESKKYYHGIRANLVIRVLVNTLEVNGSGELLKNKRISNKQARVVLETRGTTKDVFLSSNDFSKENVDHEFMKRSGETHVVLRITYGYQFFLMLETIWESEEEKLKFEGKLKVKVASLLFQSEGKGDGSYELKEENRLHELRVILYGSVHIPSNTISFEEAIVIYKRIPELVTESDCPMTIHLLPLASVCSSLPKVCSHINETLLNSVTAVFEDISNSEMALRGIQISDLASREPRIQTKAKILSTMLKEHKVWMQMELHNIISGPMMEKDSSESEQIQRVLRKHEMSPFSAEILGRYVSKLEKEVRFIENLVRMLTLSHEDVSSGDGRNREEGECGRDEITIVILSEVYPFPCD